MSMAADRQLARINSRGTIWRALGVAAALLMDVCWVAAWLRLIAGDQGPPPPGVLVVWLMAVGITSYAVGRLSHRLYLKAAVQHIMGGVGLVLAFLLSLDLVESSLHGLDLGGAVVHLIRSLSALLPVPDEVVIFLAVVILWQRGGTLAGTPELSWGREGLHFRLGVLLYALYIGARKDIEGAPIPDLLPTFFMASLLAMAVARANSLAHQPGGSRAPITLRWMAGLAGLLALTTILGVGVGYALNSQIAHQGVILVGLIVGAILSLIFRLLLPVLMLFNPLLQLLIDWLHQLFAGLSDVMGRVQVNPVQVTPEPGAENAAPPGWLQALSAAWPIIQWALILLAAGAVIYLVTRSRLRKRQDTHPDLVLDEDLVQPHAGRDGPGLLQEAQSRLGAWIRSVTGRPWLAPYVIRRIYSSMLAKAAEDGRPRRADETPAEFQQVLGDIYPAAAESAREITGAYELVRYGLRPEDPHIVERVREAWAKLKQVTP